MDSESIKSISKATINEPDTRYMGVLVLTDFRLIYKMENEKYLNLKRFKIKKCLLMQSL